MSSRSTPTRWRIVNGPAMSEPDDTHPDDAETSDDETSDAETPAPPTVLVPTRYGWERVPEDTAAHWSELVWHDRPPR